MINEVPTSEAIALFSDMRISNATLSAITKMGITSPTPIQAAAIPSMLDGRDLIGQARTGSGKTLAFGIPGIESIDTRLRGIQMLVLTPTRELAIQVGGVLEALAGPKGVKVGLVYGGKAMGPQRDMLRRGVHVVVGTPGRVLDLLNQGALWLDKVRFLVLDEADEMLDRGFAPDVERILSRTTPDRQTALFSATLPDWVRKTADKHLNYPETVTVDPNPEDIAPVEHVAYDLFDVDKMTALRDLLDHRGEGSIIIFGRTKHGVKKLARQLEMSGYPVGALQGNLSQNARDQVMMDFRSGKTPILFATNVAARGIDVSDVVAVINVELPESPELLTHRIGRTGRMGRKGIAITLLGAEDSGKWRQLEKGLGRRIPRMAWQGAEAAYGGAPEDVIAAAAAAPPIPTHAPRASSAPRSSSAPRAPRAPRGTTPVHPGQPAQASVQARPASPTRAIASTPSRTRAGGRPAFGQAAPSEATILPQTEPNQAAVARASGRRGPSFSSPTPRAESASAAPAKHVSHAAAPKRESKRHQIECSGCGKPAEVRFQPDPTRPVYCDACFTARPRRDRRSSEATAQA